MNSLVQEFSPQRVPGTFALAFGAALVVSPAVWPVGEIPRVSANSPTESFSDARRIWLKVDQTDQTHATFEQQISEIYATLASQQIPLDREIATIWDAHAEELYES
jgi:hypothetical protein